MTGSSKITWPEGKAFAFSIFDDTDRATLENNRAVYGLLEEQGLRTTKSVWVVDGDSPPYIPGITCDDPEYVNWLLELQEKGFEIAWHNATWETSPRERTIQGLERFKELFGKYPDSMANHASNGEGIYWGSNRLGGISGKLAKLIPSKLHFSGHDENSPLFWGDSCLERIRYVRNFVFHDIDTLAKCPQMPYYDPEKPWVNRWFASSAGADVDEFTKLLTPENIDKLEKSGSACIVYTHFGKRFVEEDGIQEEFRKCINDLASRNGWFVPVTTILDYLEESRQGSHILSPAQRRQLEARWIIDRAGQTLSR